MMSTRVRSNALVRDTRSDKDASRCSAAATVAMAGVNRRCMNCLCAGYGYFPQLYDALSHQGKVGLGC